MASKLSIIIEREYKTRVYKKSFIVLTLLGPLFFLLMSALPALLMQFGGEDEQVIAVIDRTGLYHEVLQSNDKYTFVHTDKDLSYYRQKGVKEAEISGILEIRQDLREDPKALTLYSYTTLPEGVEEYIDSSLSAYTTRQNLLSHNMPGIEEAIASSQNSVRSSSYKLGEDGAETQTSGAVARALGLILAITIYMFISLYGGSVLQSVMEEKKSRIMEVMISSVRPFELMMGKIIGVGLVGLTQIAIWLVLLTLIVQGLGYFSILRASPEVLSPMGSVSTPMPSEYQSIMATLSGLNFVEIALCFVLYFVGGFLVYASIYAGLGSAISSDEDAQSMMSPIVLVMLSSFYIGFACADSPESTLAMVASYIPFTSPIVMMIRIPYGVAWWEILLSMLVLYAGFVLMVFVGSRIYRVGVLMYGKKPSLLEILRWVSRG